MQQAGRETSRVATGGLKPILAVVNNW